MKTALYFLYTFLALACIGGSVFLSLHKKPAPVVAPPIGYKDATYIIDGKIVKLTNGVAETEALGPISKTSVRYFGNEVRGDLNGDTIEDIAFLLTQQPPGASVFYYVVVALGKTGGYTGTNAILLGDRIAPATSEIHGNELVINYADRKLGEPFTEAPSTAFTKYFVIKNNQLEKVTKLVTYTNNEVALSVDIDPDVILGYTVNSKHLFQPLTPEKEIKGIRFTIPEPLIESTNLAEDTYVSVESFTATTTCVADLFLSDQIAPSKLVLEDGVSYSVASGGGAAAGNRYDQTVYVLQDRTGPCVAIRYFIHSSAIENYTDGTMGEFDKKSLLAKFDSIRKGLLIH